MSGNDDAGYVVSLANGATFNAHRDETILAAAQRAQWMVRYGCRNGNCEICEARLLQGEVMQRDGVVAAHAATKILLCQCFALSDITLGFDRDPAPGNIDSSERFYAQLVDIRAAGNGSILEFALPAGRKPQLSAGQFAVIEANNGGEEFVIDAIATTPRKLILHAQSASAFAVGRYYHVRYPVGAGHKFQGTQR